MFTVQAKGTCTCWMDSGSGGAQGAWSFVLQMFNLGDRTTSSSEVSFASVGPLKSVTHSMKQRKQDLLAYYLLAWWGWSIWRLFYWDESSGQTAASPPAEGFADTTSKCLET